MLPTRLRSAVAVVASVAALLVSGCGVERAADSAQGAKGAPRVEADGSTSNGASSTVPGPERPENFEGTGGVVYLRKAADHTASIESMSVSTVVEMHGFPMVGDMKISVEGESDSAANKAHLKMDMGDLFGSFGGSTGLPADAGSMEMIVDGDTTYVKSGLFALMPGADQSKPWFSAPTGKISDNKTLSQGTADPKELLEFIRTAGGEVTEVGHETVRGTETTHLSTVIDIDKLAESAPASDKAALEKSLEKLGAAGITEFPLDAWVDSDGRVRKMVMKMDMSKVGSGQVEMDGATMTVTVEMFDFGEPVDIDVPPTDQVQALDLSMFGN